MGVHVSASQVETFLGCQRKWYFKSILGIPDPPKSSQAIGTALHLILEVQGSGHPRPPRSRTRATPQEWDVACRLADQMLPRLPPDPGKKIRREYRFAVPTYPGGPPFVGFMDLAIPRGVGWPAMLVPGRDVVVCDFKTTSDPKWIKTGEELETSVQMTSYAHALLEEDPDCEGAVLVHLYGITRAPIKSKSVRPSSTYMSRGEVETRWKKTLDTIRALEDCRQRTQASDVDPTGLITNHCDAFGGCPYKSRCGAHKRVFAAFGSAPPLIGDLTLEQLNLLDRIRAASVSSTTSVASPWAAPLVGVVAPDAPPRAQAEITVPSTAGVAPPEPAPPPSKKKKVEQVPPNLEADLAAILKEVEKLKAENTRLRSEAVTPTAQQCVVYIDALPVKGVPAVSLAEWLKPITQKISADNEVSDWRLIPYTARGVLSAGVAKYLVDYGPPPAILIPSSASGAEEVLENLLPLATHVIRGIR